MLTLLLLHPLASSAAPASLRVTVEYAAAPLALEELAPRFSWTIPADGSQRGEMQTSYAIAVASSAAGLAAALATAPRVASNQSVLRRLTQPSELQPGALYYAQVVVNTTQRRGLTAASPVLLGTAPTEDDYKQASFIGLASAANTSCPWLRKDIAPPDGWAAPGRAIAYVASVGYHELYVSGVKASPDVLAPSVSDLVRKGLFYGI
jgi:alpha-L-rhamnosidase